MDSEVMNKKAYSRNIFIGGGKQKKLRVEND